MAAKIELISTLLSAANTQVEAEGSGDLQSFVGTVVRVQVQASKLPGLS
jgi:hypothetical protein